MGKRCKIIMRMRSKSTEAFLVETGTAGLPAIHYRPLLPQLEVHDPSNVRRSASITLPRITDPIVAILHPNDPRPWLRTSPWIVVLHASRIVEPNPSRRHRLIGRLPFGVRSAVRVWLLAQLPLLLIRPPRFRPCLSFHQDELQTVLADDPFDPTVVATSHGIASPTILT